MEKLQKALEKAREQRSSQAHGELIRRRDATRVADLAPEPEASPWNDLAEAKINQDHLVRNRIVAMSAGSQATPFDILRTKVQLQMQKNGWTRLGITSPTSTCGKTTLACNLALAMRRQADLRAILVELDLRRPNIGAMLGFMPDRDVTEMLLGKVPFDRQAMRSGQNVAISAARAPASDPTTTLMSNKTHGTLNEIEADYAPDMMIFDLPPLLVTDDTRAFLKNVDCVLMVAKAEATTVSQIDTCEREIGEQTNVLGVVLNQCRYTDETSSYGDYAYGG